MRTSETEWRELCHKLAVERDPVRLGALLTRLDEIFESHLQDLEAEKRSAFDEIGKSRHIY
jgi:hypothetical protein